MAYLSPWKGYLIWNGAPGAPLSDSLWIQVLEYGEPLAKSGQDASGTRIGLIVESGGWRDGRAVFSFGCSGCEDGMDAGDHPKPMMVPKPLDLSVVVSWDEGGSYLTDSREELGAGQSWCFRVKNGASDRAVLRFSGLESLGEGVEAVLLDEVRDRVWPLSSGIVEYTRESPEAEKFELLIGSSDYLETRVEEFGSVARVFSLAQNSPNPFSGVTAIRYSLPLKEKGAMPVRLQIFNLQGRMVAELVNESQPPGLYSVIWRGTDKGAMPVPAGTYICRLRAGKQFEARRKMLLLR